MSLKEMVIQEIENASEPLLEKVLEFIRSSQDPLIARLNHLRDQGEYADDVTDEETKRSDAAYQDYVTSKDPGTSLSELELELFGGDS
jgi:hypothetical protein